MDTKAFFAEPLKPSDGEGGGAAEDASEEQTTESELLCHECREEIIRDSRDHDNVIIVNDGEDIVCEGCHHLYEYCYDLGEHFLKGRHPWVLEEEEDAKAAHQAEGKADEKRIVSKGKDVIIIKQKKKKE